MSNKNQLILDIIIQNQHLYSLLEYYQSTIECFVNLRKANDKSLYSLIIETIKIHNESLEGETVEELNNAIKKNMPSVKINDFRLISVGPNNRIISSLIIDNQIISDMAIAKDEFPESDVISLISDVESDPNIKLKFDILTLREDTIRIDNLCEKKEKLEVVITECQKREVELRDEILANNAKISKYMDIKGDGKKLSNIMKLNKKLSTVLKGCYNKFG